ncbi:MAG: hydroxymethylglutaryl-CoA lyase [Gammaproteobacteria bacterium]
METRALPPKVTVVEVGPRDGLQNERVYVDAAAKVELIDQLARAGFQAIEVTGFAHPERVPQLADAEEVYAHIAKREGVRYIALVPNLRALQRACAAGVTQVAVITAASDTFNQRNIHCDTAESLRRLEPMLALCAERGLHARAYVSCALGCPYEGEVDAAMVADLAARLYGMGCGEIVLADTIGAGTARAAQWLLERVGARVPVERIAVHFHNTRGQALANILACLELGVTTIDASVAGLGGCPFALGASGNVASEDLIYMLHGLGIATGVDLAQLISIGRGISERLGRSNESAVGRAGPFAGRKTAVEAATASGTSTRTWGAST